MNNLQPHQPVITKLCEIYKVKKLYAFGSVLTENFKAESDIDLIVEFENIELEEYADNYFGFKFSLQDVLKRPVDLLEDKAIKNPHFRKTIEKHKEPLYIAPNQFISKEQIQYIEESKLQIQHWNYLTNDQANILVDHWLDN